MEYLKGHIEPEVKWQTHSQWAHETAYRYLNLQSKDLQKKLLSELAEVPASISRSSLAMSSSFAFHLLEGLASGLGQQLKESEIQTLIERSINIFVELDSRSNSDFSKKTAQQIFKFLEEIDLKAEPQVPFWSLFFNESNYPSDTYAKKFFEKCRSSLSQENSKQQRVKQLIYTNEPFLAWKQIKSSSHLHLGALDNLMQNRYLELVSFGLFSDPEMIKPIIRKFDVTQNAEANTGLMLLYFILMARGDFEWIEDHTLVRPLQKIMSSSESELGKILNLFILLIQNKSKSRFQKQLRIRNILNLISNLNKYEDSLVCIGALHTFVRRERLATSGQSLTHFYQTLSGLVSEGLTDNLWKLLTLPENKKKQFLTGVASDIPSSKVARTLEATSVTFKLTGLLGPRRLGKILSGRAQSVVLSELEIDKALSIIIPYLSKMKGPLMKLGQTLSYTHLGLPPHLLDQLKSLQCESSPLDFETIFRQVQKNEKLFSQMTDMESFPIGVGSLGQVHRVKLKDGRQVVAKVKFPNIEKIIQDDLEILKSVVGIIELLVPRLQLKPYVAELHNQLALECDYLREARSQMSHRSRMEHLKSLYIPEVYLDLSNENVLVSEYMEGMKFKEACQSGTQAQKDLWGKTLVEYTVSACRDGHFNSDSHPGNLLFQEDRLVYFDFGSVREWDAHVMDAWNYLIMSCLRGEPELVLKAFAGFKNTGVTQKNSQSLVAVLQNPVPGSWTVPGRQTLLAESLKKQMMELAKITSAKRNGINMPKEFLLGTRVYFGHLSVVISLGSQADWFEVANQVMEQWAQKNLSNKIELRTLDAGS